MLHKLSVILLLFLELAFVNFYKESFAQSCPSQTQYSSNYAILVGEIIETGGENNIQTWFDWGTTPSLENSTPRQDFYITSLPYRFCYTLSNLNPCTTYYYRAVIRNSQGINYGQTYSFQTSCQNSQRSLNVFCYALPNPADVNSLVNFYSIVNNGSGNYSYSWSGACSSFSSICSNIFSYPGTYTAYLNVSNGSLSKTTSCSVNVISQSTSTSLSNQIPIAIISFSPENILPGTIITFDASRSYDPDGFITSYSWYINDKLVSRNISFSRALPSGNHKIKLIVTDNLGKENSKEILIHIGRNVYKTRVITKTVTSPLYKTKLITSSRLVDLFLNSSYKIKVCSSSNLQFTLINNTNVNREIKIEINNETKNWFNPVQRSFIVSPKAIEIISWKINVPCYIKEGAYKFTLKVSTPGEKFEKNGFLEVKKESNLFIYLLGIIGITNFLKNFWWLILILLLIIFVYLGYRYIKKRT